MQEADFIARYRGGSLAMVMCSEMGLRFSWSEQNEYQGICLDTVAEMLSSAG